MGIFWFTIGLLLAFIVDESTVIDHNYFKTFSGDKYICEKQELDSDWKNRKK